MKRIFHIIAAIAILASCTTTPVLPEIDFADSVIYEINTRQYTPEGTLQAAAEQLPRLKELGVDIVWLMPIYPIGELGRKGSLGSYYAIRNYCDVNPEFGTLEDFDAFVQKAHSLGIRVVLDWVANHTSPDHPWVREKAADWYVRDEHGNTIVEYDWTDIAKLNYECQDMRKAMQQSMLFWLQRGIDGFRCDMASLVPQDFWQPTISMLRQKAGKQLFFLAEGEEPWLHEAGFDATYAWRLHHLLNDIAQGKAELSAIDEYLQWNAENFPEGALRLAFTSNHDENSWAGTEFERMGDRWKEMTEICWNLPGHMPLIYTGQEMGWNKRFEFFEKDHIPAWEDNAYTEYYRQLAQKKHFCGKVEHIEPLCWWVGMNTPLQLMVHGGQIGSYSVEIEGGKGVSVEAVHGAESPNYLFIDVKISPKALPGTYYLVFSRDGESFKIPYQIEARKEGSADRQSFSTADFIYLIMPDRFVNADCSNDNTDLTSELADAHAFFGRHGGDIAGIRSQLGYLQDLGVTAIWNTPLLEDNEPRESYHGYACTDYYHIDSRFGSNADYRALVADGHAHGIKTIMDIVTNHCGDAHWWMKDLPFSDWVHQWPEYTHSNCCFSMQNDPYASTADRANMEGGWFDRSMVDMNLDNPWLLQYFKQWAIWWIEWADLDGLRVDTYPYNEKIPMSQWCAAVRAEYPNINIVGEVWTNNVPQLAYWQANNPNKDGFNSNLPSIMDFPLQSAILGGLSYDGQVNWDEGLVKVYDAVANDLYYHDMSHMMIFPGNHDQERLADCLGKDPRKVKMAMALLCTLRGIPQLLYADELMGVSRDQRQGHGGLRIDFPLDWTSSPASRDMHDYCRTLFNWRKTATAVHDGNTKHFLRRDNTYAYFRYNKEQTIFVFLNNTNEQTLVPWTDYAEFASELKTGRNVISGETVDFSAAVSVGAKEALIVEF